MISVVLPYGIDAKTGKWTDGYETRNDPGHGFSHPDNKANHVARWLLAMSDATGKAVYKERAEKWFRLMKSRMKLKADGTYEIWNYWEPAGLGLQARRLSQALGGRASQRRLLRDRLDRHRGRLRARPGVHAAGHQPCDRHRHGGKALLGCAGAIQPGDPEEI